MSGGNPFAVDPATVAELCQRHGIKRLAVFGSALTSAFSPASDIDLLVEFDPDRVPGLIRLAEIERELEAVFEGHEVELRTYEDLSPRFRDRVRSEARELYAAA